MWTDLKNSFTIVFMDELQNKVKELLKLVHISESYE